MNELLFAEWAQLVIPMHCWCGRRCGARIINDPITQARWYAPRSLNMICSLSEDHPFTLISSLDAYPLLLGPTSHDLLICSSVIFNIVCHRVSCHNVWRNMSITWPPFLEPPFSEPPHSTSLIWQLFLSQAGRTLSRFSLNSINEAWGQRDLTFRRAKTIDKVLMAMVMYWKWCR